jgi:hypothetical protein
LENAVRTWGEYLRGERNDLEAYPLWFTPLDVGLSKKVDAYLKSDGTDGKGAAPVTNRYFANWLGCEVATYERSGCALVWAKTSFWLIAGVIAVPDETDYYSIELSPTGGTFPAANHALPPVVLATLGHQGWEYLKKSSEMIAVQRDKIKADWTRNQPKVASSAQSRSLQEDVETFGDAAWVEVPKGQEP